MGFINPVLSHWSSPRIANVDDAANNAFLQDDDLAVLKVDAGKARGIGFTGLQQGVFFLGNGRVKADGCQNCQQQQQLECGRVPGGPRHGPLNGLVLVELLQIHRVHPASGWHQLNANLRQSAGAPK